MSNAGLIIRNNAGQVIIDGTYSNPSLRVKGTTATTSAVGSASYVSFSVSGLTATPVIAVSCAAGAIAHVSSYSNGEALVEIIAAGDVGTSVDWYVFDEPGYVTAPKYFVVRNAAGKVVFSATEKYMRVVTSLSVDPTTGTAATLASGKTYASYLAGPVARSVVYNNSGEPTDHNWYITSVRQLIAISGNQIATVERDLKTSGPYVQSTKPQSYSFGSTTFVLDVTNY